MRKQRKAQQIINIALVIALVLTIYPPILWATAHAETLKPPPTQPILTTTDPAIVSNPLTIARVQTSYESNSEAVIAFTVHNNLPTTRQPEIAADATITETIETLAAFSATADMNALHNVTLVTTMTTGTVIDAVGATIDGDTVTWDLESLAPFSSEMVTMTVQTPATAADFVDLDEGAVVSAEMWNAPINTQARPAVIIPDSVSPTFTDATVDADSDDADMLLWASQQTQDPLDAFAFVQAMDFDPYNGSLRGTRGTLWNDAGNSVDQASLLLAMLRAAGVPARYRHGTLSVGDAQTLIASQFPAAQGVAGYLPAGSEIADPVNDAELIALVQDHWWVEAYLPGTGWTDLDPSFATASVGDSFATPGANDQIAELPDAVRHKVTMRLEVEQYSQFPIQGGFLSTIEPLEETFASAEIAAKQVTFGHLVSTEVVGGLVAATVQHTYTPYFSILDNDIVYEGDPFVDLLTNFPLGTTFSTAEWLHYEVQNPNGNVEAFTRPVRDLLGAGIRQVGGIPDFALDETDRFVDGGDLYVNWVLPNDVPEWALRRTHGNFLSELVAMAQQIEVLRTAPLDAADPIFLDELGKSVRDALLVGESGFGLLGLDFGYLSDQTNAQLEAGLRTKLFYESPRIFTAAASIAPDRPEATVDLRTTRAATLVYPGQSERAGFTTNWLKGVLESQLEGDVLALLTGEQPLTTMRVFEEMTAQGIAPILLTPDEVFQLDLYPYSDDAYAYILDALQREQWVLAPSQPVLLDGELVTAWWEIDPSTGETISVGENGLHVSASAWAKILEQVIGIVDFFNPTPGAMSEAQLISTLMDIGSKLERIYNDIAEQFGDATGNRGVEMDAGWWHDLPAHLCPPDNCGVEQFFLADVMATTMPLSEMAFVYDEPTQTFAEAFATVQATDNGGGGADAFTLTANPTSAVIAPTGMSVFSAEIDPNFTDDFRVAAYAPEGWDVSLADDGTVTVEPPNGATPDDYTILVVAQSDSMPELVETAEHTVTITALDQVQFSVSAEPSITVAIGDEVVPAVSGETNDGSAEIPDSAYRIDLTNDSTTAKTITLDVSGAPAGWSILDGLQQTNTTIDLPAGASTTVGFYLLPDALPAPGTTHNIDISADDGGAFNAIENIVWTMPGQAHNYVTIQPDTLYVSQNDSVEFQIDMSNVGNTAGTFPLTASVPISTWTVTNLPADMMLAVGASTSTTVTLNVTDGVLGRIYPLQIASDAPNSYTQYAFADVQIVSDITEDVFEAADEIANSCPLGDPLVSGALNGLAEAMVELEYWCGIQDCPLPLRDNVVNTANQVATFSAAIAPIVTNDSALQQVADDLSTQTDNGDILSELANMSVVVGDLSAEICHLSDHLPALTWQPGYDAALVGETVTYTLDLTNHGTVTTTYALTISTPTGDTILNPTVDPGATDSFDVPTASAVAGLFDLTATATFEDITISADAGLNVVDRYVQLLSVNPDPAFVETGISSSDISIEVANIANVPIDATAHVEVVASDGMVLDSANVDIVILPGSPATYALNTVDTSGFSADVYTVTVDLGIPDGTGYGYLSVGQGLGASHTIQPTIVAPGTATVTTVISTSILAQTIAPIPIEQPLWEPTGLREVSEQPSAISSQPETVENPAPAKVFGCGSFCRYENDDVALVYSGAWSDGVFGRASAGNVTSSNVTSDTLDFTFTGEWVSIGFVGNRNSGEADIYIDGNLVETVDLYRTDQRSVATIHPDLGGGAHTLSVTVRGTNHPNSFNTWVHLDYVDVWDGTPLADGTFEEQDVRVYDSNNFFLIADPIASGGEFYQDDGFNTGSIWFPFYGDSITVKGIAGGFSRETRIYVDEQLIDEFNYVNAGLDNRDFSLDGFGANQLHILRLERHHGEMTLDAFAQPGSAPFYEVPTFTGLNRYEEDDLTYGGDSWEQRPDSWSDSYEWGGSNSYVAHSSTPGDSASLDFTGSWVNIGWKAWGGGGSAEIYLDGALLDTVSLSHPTEVLSSTQYSVLTGTHTLSITVVSGNTWLDYIDVWDGTAVSDDYIDASATEETGRTAYNISIADFADANATDGDYAGINGIFNFPATIWYTFVGENVAFRWFSRQIAGSVEVYIDNELVEEVSLVYDFTTQSFIEYYETTPGPHVVRIENISHLQVDGFQSNVAVQSQPQPFVEWYDTTGAGGSGAFNTPGGPLMGIAAGDIDGDGIVEIVGPSDTTDPDSTDFVNSIFIMNGDGSDAGDGTPVTERIDFRQGGVEREKVGSVALADLDGNAGSEIVIAGEDGMYAFYNDGTTYWFTDTFKSFVNTSTPAIGNLDAEPAAEIVINMGQDLVVYEADGDIAWSTSMPVNVGMPVLADFTGDTYLDIAVADDDGIVYLYDYNFGAPTLEWTFALSTTIGIARGGPAVADVDGDGSPDLAIAHDGWLTVLDQDGVVIWQTQLDAGNPGGVSIADIDGDTEIELVTGMMYDDGVGIGRLYALNADGSILWDQPAYDSTSANSQSVLDVNGDGVYEIAWNGKETGFTIFNGADGSVLYNEPLINSLTGSEYPIFADVDLDGSAEIVVPYNKGFAVIGMDGLWGEARPLWNQHTYHITNVNDDLTIPASELDSWEIHNTYRTQWDSAVVLPVYGVTISHTVGITDVAVVADSFNVVPDLSAEPLYIWEYVQTIANETVTRTFDSVLTNLQPGETRLVAAGTEVAYTLQSGQNLLTLPPLYVAVPHIISLDPFSQTVGAGAIASFNVTLSNPTDSAETYTLNTTGLDSDSLVAWPSDVNVPAQSEVIVPLMIATSVTGVFDFAVTVTTTSGGEDGVTGQLSVFDALDVLLEPQVISADAGEVATYTATISNHLATQQTVQLTTSGIPNVNAPASVLVAGNSAAQVAVTAQGFVAGGLPFTIVGTNENGATASDSGILDVASSQQVLVELDPATAQTGRGVPVVVNVTVTNTGDQITTYDLAVTASAGWDAQLAQSQVTIAPAGLNTVAVQLILTPPADETPADYDFTVTATAADDNRDPSQPATGAAMGTITVTSAGVAVNITPATQVVFPDEMALWQVGITNVGASTETFDLAANGIAALSASFSSDTVMLNAGETQTVTLTANDLTFALPTTYTVGVVATAQSDASVQDVAFADLIVADAEAVAVAWTPISQTVDVDEVANYMLTITNTGNTLTPYDVLLSASEENSATVTLSQDTTSIFLPAHTTALVLVQASADANGLFNLDGEAASPSGTSDAGQAFLNVSSPTAIVLTNSHATTAPHAILFLWFGLAVLTVFAKRRMR